MKRLTFSLLIGCMAVINLCAQWQAVDRTKLDKSGEIPATVNSMAIADGKLYAATTDGIWESPSMNGGDWTAFGLQGQEVRLLNFKDAKLAIISGDQLYKFDEGVWKLTKFNEKQEGGFFTQTSFAQIRDKEGKLVIVVPTWGQGIWRSEDGGETWTQSPMVTQTIDDTEVTCGKNGLSLYTFENDTVIYGTDKTSGKIFCLARSFDYGKTWEFVKGPYVFNPWSFHKRMYKEVETYYFGGENGVHSLEKSIDEGVTWVGFPNLKSNNRCMLGKDDGPLFAMFSQDGVYVSKDDGVSLEPLGTGLVITNANSKSLTHMVMTDEKLYCSALEDGIQVFDLAYLDDDVPVKVEGTSLNRLSVYPNPVQNYVVVPADANSTVTLTDMRGAVLYQSAGGDTRIDVSDFTSGMYMVRYQQNGVSLVEKIVKK